MNHTRSRKARSILQIENTPRSIESDDVVRDAWGPVEWLLPDSFVPGSNGGYVEAHEGNG